MGKGQKFFDFMTVFTIFMASMAVSAIVSSGDEPGKGGSVMTVVVLGFLIAIFYSIMIVILGIRKSKKFSHGVFIAIGSIVLVILPVIYYLTYLRPLMDEPSAKEQFQQLVQTIQQNPQQFQQIIT